MNYARIGALVIALLGIAVLVLGITLYTKSTSGREQLATALQPTKIEELDAKGEALSTKLKTVASAEEPNIQAGKAAPSDTYNYLLAQSSILNLTKTTAGIIDLTEIIGIVSMIAGVALLLAGGALFFLFQALSKMLAGLGPMLAAAKAAGAK